MTTVSARLTPIVERLLSVGAYPDEPGPQRARRRIMMGSLYLVTVVSIPTIFTDFSAGFTWVGWGGVAIVVATVVALVAVSLRPRSFPVTINLLFAVVTVAALVETTLFGGLYGSGLIVIFGLIVVLAALVAVGIRAGIWWCLVFALSVAYAAMIEGRVDPLYVMENPAADAAFNVVIAGVVTLLVLLYFIRQRDRLQGQSDDLLHNILPAEIVERLKMDDTMIADSFAAASVLFADVVDFTPMSAGMSPSALVGLLNSVFITLDGFVEDLGLEKIKTVGDEYMVAAGVPQARSDHAEAAAELALRIRDHVSANDFDGHQIQMRIGINSGSVVAGIIGRHKFAYDLWGDVVNVASRMQSEGLPGVIQVSATTYELIRDRFVCEPRGTISVKGKGDMETYILHLRRPMP